jgi:cyclopropane fatty-acyl-phospholipid synthase-like methyltransferase
VPCPRDPHEDRRVSSETPRRQNGNGSPGDAATPEVRSYYELLGELYRAAWGDSIHFSVFSGAEPREAAAAATERLLADEGGFGPGMFVLDVGCGPGGPALTIAEHSGAHVTGVDLVPRHVALARSKAAALGLADRTTFVEADATALPFAGESFDHVYAIESAYHAGDKARFYAECARVLRPGGSFVGTDWLRSDDLSEHDRDRYIEPVRHHHAIPSLIGLSDVRAHLERAGLVPEVVQDLAERGDVLRNWEPLGEGAWPRLAVAVQEGPPEALRTWRAGAQALQAAASAGAFVIGYWLARKPAR